MIKVCKRCGKKYNAWRNKQQYCSLSCATKNKPQNTLDLTGKVFGEITIIEYVKTKNNRRYWKAQCNCGRIGIYESSRFNRTHSPTRCCKVCGLKKGNDKRRLPFGIKARNDLFVRYKSCAKDRGLCFNLNMQQFTEITKKNCCYCNSEPNNGRYNDDKGDYVYNGIDRIDNTKGYEIDNVVPCCEKCNRMKMALKKEVFLSHVKRINDFQNLTKSY